MPVEQLGELNLLRIRASLIRLRRTGELFIPQSISDLSIERPFELYWAKIPIFQYRNAFPVSRRRYRRFFDKKEQIFWLKEQYEIYYEECACLQPDFFFHKLTIHSAERYIWFFQQNFKK